MLKLFKVEKGTVYSVYTETVINGKEITWSIINRSFCSFKLSSDTQKFCRNEYNLTGLCSRSSCPLANTQYATIREEKGLCYLYIRTAERAFFPAKQWEKIRLSRSFRKAVEQIDTNLVFWKAYFRQKCRQRLLKISQYLSRMRKLRLQGTKRLIPIRQKIDRRTKNRENKALIAAKIDNVVEKKLLQRLKDGTYDRIYNFPKNAFENRTSEAIEEEEVENYETSAVYNEEEEEEDENLERILLKDSQLEEDENSEESEDDGETEREFVCDFDESDDEDIDIEDAVALIENEDNEEQEDDNEDDEDDNEDDDSEEEEEDSSRKKKRKVQKLPPRKTKRAKVVVEYETDERVPVKIKN